jgi:S1-C subfamily serine protease
MLAEVLMAILGNPVAWPARFASAAVLSISMGAIWMGVATSGVAATSGGTDSIAAVVDKVSPAVVRIVTHGEQDQPVMTVAAVDPTGTAADSGIQKGDVIVEVQQTAVGDTASALHIFNMQSIPRRRFTAVLVERDKKRSWTAIAMPN